MPLALFPSCDVSDGVNYCLLLFPIANHHSHHLNRIVLHIDFAVENDLTEMIRAIVSNNQSTSLTCQVAPLAN